MTGLDFVFGFFTRRSMGSMNILNFTFMKKFPITKSLKPKSTFFFMETKCSKLKKIMALAWWR